MLLSARAQATPPLSLPGDADCDGLVTPADLDHLRAEFTDGDGEKASDVDGGSVVSCSGADANGDGLISAADLSALTRILYGETNSAGPVITFIGIAGADGTAATPVTDVPVPLFQVISGLGFHIVIEAAPGPSNLPVGQRVLNSVPHDPTARPDLQVEVSRDLGDGNLAVCGEGGVPGVAPANYGPQQAIADALNDLSCRFDVTGNPALACTIDEFGVHRFIDARSRLQFCLPVSAVELFPQALTIVTARVLDTAGDPGPPAQMVLRVGNEPVATATARPTATPKTTATATDTVTPGPSPTDTATAADTRTGTPIATGMATPSGTRTLTNTAGPSPTVSATPSRSSTGTPTHTHTRGPSPTVSATQTVTRTPTSLSSPTRTAFASGTPTNTRPRTPTVTGSPPATGTRTAPGTRTETASRTPTGTMTGTRTARPTDTATGSATATRTRTGTPTASSTGSLPPTRTSSVTRTPNATATPSLTRPPTATSTGTRTATVTRTSTAINTGTATRTVTQTRTPSRTGTSTRTATITQTPTITLTPSQTGTPTATPRAGADITYVGLARADDMLIDSIGMTSQGWPIYERPIGYLFSVVVEAKPGPNRRPVGLNAFRSSPSDPSVRPDFEIIVSRPLGDGSPAVCDNMPPIIGGVPASASFDLTQPVSNAINDFGCRFVNGAGEPRGRSAGEACTVFSDGEFRFANGASTAQFCAGIAAPFGFPAGDTVVTVRVRDATGAPGPPASFVVRVMP